MRALNHDWRTKKPGETPGFLSFRPSVMTTGDIAFENTQVGPAERRLCDPDDSVWRFVQHRLGTNLQGFLTRAGIDEHFQHDTS